MFFDREIKLNVVRLVTERGRPVSEIARDLGINENILWRWCVKRAGRRAGAGISWTSHDAFQAFLPQGGEPASAELSHGYAESVIGLRYHLHLDE